MLYIVEFVVVFCAILGFALFGIFALSKVLGFLLAVAVIVYFLRIEAGKGLFIVGGGFAFAAAVSGALAAAF